MQDRGHELQLDESGIVSVNEVTCDLRSPGVARSAVPLVKEGQSFRPSHKRASFIILHGRTHPPEWVALHTNLGAKVPGFWGGYSTTEPVPNPLTKSKVSRVK
jgi:hypothetical protein